MPSPSKLEVEGTIIRASDEPETLPGLCYRSDARERTVHTPLPKQIWGHSVGLLHIIPSVCKDQTIDNSPTSLPTSTSVVGRGAEKKNKQTSSYPQQRTILAYQHLISERDNAPQPPTAELTVRQSHASVGFETTGFFINHQISLSSLRDRPSRPMLTRLPSSALEN